MINSIEKAFAFDEKALALRDYRQQMLASNIANADTPNYKAVDVDFAKAMQTAGARSGGALPLTQTSSLHLQSTRSNGLAGVTPQFRSAVQPSIDGNTVDTHIEQAQFSENALRYMASLQFMNGKIKDMQLAIKGSN